MFSTLLNWFMGRQGRHGWLDFGFQYTLIRNNQSKKNWSKILDLAWLKFAVDGDLEIDMNWHACKN